MQGLDPQYQATQHTPPFAQTRWDVLPSMLQRAPMTVPRDRRPWAVWASLTAHGLLVVGLMLSVAWKSSPPAALQAELWDAIPSAPAVAAPDPASTPVPEPSPEPPTPAAPVAKPAPEPDAIAPKHVNPTKTPPKETKPAPEPIKSKPVKTPPTTPQKQDKPDPRKERALEAERAKEMARINSLLGTGGAPKQGTPQAGSPTGIGAQWGAKLKACVQPHLRFADGNAGNLKAEFLVQLLPSRTPVATKLVKSSGNAAFDAAVERAILRCDPFPADDKPLPTSMNIVYRLND